jgi:hypothetical protein
VHAIVVFPVPAEPLTQNIRVLSSIIDGCGDSLMPIQ